MKPARILLIPAAMAITAACSTSPTSDAADPSASGGSPAAESSSTSGPYDAEPYCELTRRLESAGEKTFADLGRNATPAQYRSAERSFVLDNENLLAGLVDAAPTHLTDEVETLLTAMRQRSGLEDSGVSQSEASDAEKRILDFEKRHC